MDMAIFRTVVVGVPRAYDVFKQNKNIREGGFLSYTFMDKNRESNK